MLFVNFLVVRKCVCLSFFSLVVENWLQFVTVVYRRLFHYLSCPPTKQTKFPDTCFVL